MLRLGIIILCCCPAFVAVAQDSSPADSQFQLERTVLVETPRCVVVQLTLSTSAESQARNTRLEWEFQRGGKGTIRESGHSTANGTRTPTGSPSRAEVLFVAQVTPANSKHPAMLLFSTKQKNVYSDLGATSSQAHRLDNDMDVSDVFHIDVESGNYALEEELEIGELAGQPIRLFFGSDPSYRGGKSKETGTSKVDTFLNNSAKLETDDDSTESELSD